MSKKRYDYVRALWSEHKHPEYLRRILRKLVREAVLQGICDSQTRYNESDKDHAKRIAKELVP